MKRFLLLGLLLFISNILNAQGWGETQKIVSQDRSIADFFGWSVAIDGDYAVVGARGGGPTGTFRGIAYVFHNDGSGVWIEVDQLTNIDNSNFDGFGYSVAISGDYIFIGATGQDYIGNGAGNYLSGAGAVYVYENDGVGNWNQVQKIVASDRDTENGFGNALAIQGNYAVVGVVKQSYDVTGSNFLDSAGAVYIFERDESGEWNEVQKIVASDRAVFDYFGRNAVAIDADFLVVGANYEDEDVSGMNTISSAGSAYVFERDGSGTWNEVQKIVASDREQGEWFGVAVDIYGETIAVGSSQEYISGNTSAQYGAVYMYEKDGAGIWNETQKIRPSNLDYQSGFGQALDLVENHLIIGASGMEIGSVPNGGAAFMFEKDGADVWNQVAVMYDTNAAAADFFGIDVAISENYAMVGSYQEDEDELGVNTLGEAGSVYVFEINEPNTLEPLETLSVFENTLESTINAYPNPVDNILHLDFKIHINFITVKVSNVLGQVVFSEKYYNSKSIELPFDMSKGMYLVEVKINNNETSVLKIIKH
ncbi:T9SS type A sorting domain-containing protein [Lacinutrix iliipiscaria]|uniref:T9SS type A sorting domain-containing protein n=1 Tax=Lacinutrix iliipiscaria TaxID=1230532 RepID=A0ABW5WL89_9FLAO